MEMLRCAVQILAAVQSAADELADDPSPAGTPPEEIVKDLYLLLKDMAYHDPHVRIALWPAADALGELLDANEITIRLTEDGAQGRPVFVAYVYYTTEISVHSIEIRHYAPGPWCAHVAAIARRLSD